MMIESWQSLFPDEPVEMQLQPVYAFNAPGESLVLYDGQVVGAGEGERPCRVELAFCDGPCVRWQTELGEHEFTLLADKAVELRIQRSGREWVVNGFRDNAWGGLINEAEFAMPDARLQRVVVHWFNLPDILARGRIATNFVAEGISWGGRWQFDVAGWRITFDRRHDYDDVIAEADRRSVYALTHVMEVRRVDDEAFCVGSVVELLECLRVCLSFGFGRWVEPALPVGYNAAGHLVWEKWEAPILEPAKKVGNAWLWRLRTQDIEELIERSLTAFLNPDRLGMTRFQMISAVQAVEAGFVEQRILAAFPALENLAWAALVLDGVVTQNEYKNSNEWRRGEHRLRHLLENARLPTDIDAESLPALASFAGERHIVDGPAAVVSVRNQLVHPKSPSDLVIYRKGLAKDVWLLSRHYLNLLILHSIGYQGSYVRLLPPFGMAGNATPVTWAAAK